GLRHCDRLDGAAGDPAEDLPLLLLGAEALRGSRDDQRRRVAADWRESARGLLHEQAGVEHPAARSAVVLGDRHAEPAEVSHLRVDLGRVRLGVAGGQALPLLARAAFARAEVADGGDEVALLVAEVEIHRRRSLWTLQVPSTALNHGRRRRRRYPRLLA